MFNELKGVVLNLYAGGVLVGVPPSLEIKHDTEQKFKVGQVVWVSFNFTNMTITSLRHFPSREATSPNNTPEPIPYGCVKEDTHPIVEDEEWLEVDDELYPDTDCWEAP